MNPNTRFKQDCRNSAAAPYFTLADKVNTILADAQKLIAEAGMSDFRTSGSAYTASSDKNIFPTKFIPIDQILPLVRGPGIHNFDRDRALSILTAMQTNQPIEPIHVDQPRTLVEPFRYRLYDGFHRFNLSVALGFTHIWAYINPSSEP